MPSRGRCEHGAESLRKDGQSTGRYMPICFRSRHILYREYFLDGQLVHSGFRTARLVVEAIALLLDSPKEEAGWRFSILVFFTAAE